MSNKTKKFKKGDSVKWKIGRATKYSKGKVFRLVRAGTEFKPVPKLITKMEEGEEYHADTYIIDAADGTRRLVRPGYLKSA